MLIPASPKDSLSKTIKLILASKRLTLHRVSKYSESLYSRGSEYFIPHNFYYELGRGSFTPSIYQIAALSRVTGYRLQDWLRLFGFELESIPRLQALLPAKRTVLIDSSLVNPATIVPWLRSKKTNVEIPRIAPLSQLLEYAGHKRIASITNQRRGTFLYAKIGWEDALAFPDLLPGSIVGIDPENSFLSVLQANDATSRLFLIEHSQGLFCCRLLKASTSLIVPLSEKLPYGQVELREPAEVKMLGAVSLEIRLLVNPKHPEVPTDLARRWTPRMLQPAVDLATLLGSGRQRMKVSLQAASAMSRRVANIMGDDRYFLSPSSLSDYEASNDPPRHIHKIITLCAVYGLRFADFLERIEIASAQLGYEVIPDQFMQQSPIWAAQEINNRLTQPDNGGFFAGLLDMFPHIPFFLRHALSEVSQIAEPALADFFWIGGETKPLHPALKGGTMVIVNRRKKSPIHFRSKPLWEQPLYLLLLRSGEYLCACCSIEDDNLVLHPYPQHSHAAVHFRNQKDAEVIGQVVTVLRRL